MLMNDLGVNRTGSSPLLRLTKPKSYALDAIVALAELGASGVERAIEAIGAWYRRQRTYRELAQLDDHLLRDIGLTRDAIPTTIVRLEAERRRMRFGGRL